MNPARIFIVIASIHLCCGISRAAAPPATPFVRINTGMHSARIQNTSTDRDEKLLATVSTDKTLKIWDRLTGRLLQTIRPPIADGYEGQLNGVALSPDGTTVAAGGPTGESWDGSYCVYIFDVTTGLMKQRLKGLPKSVYQLAYSRDGKRLVVGLGYGKGIRVYSTADGSLIFSDAAFLGHVFGIDFDSKGNLIATSDAGTIKAFNPDGTIKFSILNEGAKKIFSVRFSPDDALIALGYNDNPAIEIRSAHDGSLAFTVNDPIGNKTVARFWSVAWSADGSQILAAGGKYNNDGYKLICSWSTQTKSLDQRIVLPVKANISQLISFKDGTVLFVSNQNGFGLLDQKHRVTYFNPIEHSDFFKSRNTFKISPDATLIQFSYERNDQAKAHFEVKNRLLASGSADDTALLPPRFTGNGIDVSNWEGTAEPRLGGHNIQGLYLRETSWGLAVRHDEQGFVLGTDRALRSYDKSGRQIWMQPTPALAWEVALSGDDRILVAAFDDGTIRWYNSADGKELYAIYLHPDRKRWILWTPDGYFDHGPESEKLILFHVNKGADKAAEIVSIDRMYDLFYRPDRVDTAIAGQGKSGQQTASESIKADTSAGRQKIQKLVELPSTINTERSGELSRPLKKTSATQKTMLDALVNSATLPPSVRFITTSGVSQQTDAILAAELCDNGGGIGDITLFLNNIPITIEQNGRSLKAHAKASSAGCIRFERTITLNNDRNVISLMAFNRDNTIESTRDTIELTAPTASNSPPKLHILTVAINNYLDGDLRLKYSLNDATVLDQMLRKHAAALFSEIKTYRLHDSDVTKSNMEAIFTKIGAATVREDVFLFFIAGHGVTDERSGVYYFLPVDFRYTGEDSISTRGISINDFKKYLTSINAMKSLILLDTCNSGSFTEAISSRGITEKTAISKLSRAVGRATIAASSRNQVALEGYEGHGVFSYALLEGIKGKAADPEGRITINRLATFIEETLPALTFKRWGYEQVPQKSMTGTDFQIGVK
jgi:WD40 repeat protein